MSTDAALPVTVAAAVAIVNAALDPRTTPFPPSKVAEVVVNAVRNLSTTSGSSKSRTAAWEGAENPVPITDPSSRGSCRRSDYVINHREYDTIQVQEDIRSAVAGLNESSADFTPPSEALFLVADVFSVDKITDNTSPRQEDKPNLSEIFTHSTVNPPLPFTRPNSYTCPAPAAPPVTPVTAAPPVTPVTAAPPVTPVTAASPVTAAPPASPVTAAPPVTDAPTVTPVTAAPPVTPVTAAPPVTPFTATPPVTPVKAGPPVTMPANVPANTQGDSPANISLAESPAAETADVTASATAINAHATSSNTLPLHVGAYRAGTGLASTPAQNPSSASVPSLDAKKVRALTEDLDIQKPFDTMEQDSSLMVDGSNMVFLDGSSEEGCSMEYDCVLSDDGRLKKKDGVMEHNYWIRDECWGEGEGDDCMEEDGELNNFRDVEQNDEKPTPSKDDSSYLRQHKTALDGTDRHKTALDVTSRNRRALDGTGCNKTALDGTGQHVISPAREPQDGQSGHCHQCNQGKADKLRQNYQ